jgi:non-specific protein-tyrosine kinase
MIRDAADVVVLDSPPLEVVTDAAVLASHVDGTLLVVQAARSRRGAVKAARETLARASARVVGAALNRVANAPSAYMYGYPARESSGESVEVTRHPVSPSPRS